jgi:hypothetical protein
MGEQHEHGEGKREDKQKDAVSTSSIFFSCHFFALEDRDRLGHVTAQLVHWLIA